MSLIDASYFTGKLTIPQLGQPSVVDALNTFIQREEPRYLQAALGYELWQDFVAGLSVSPIDQKWLNLRDGVDFDATGLWPPFNWRNGYPVYNNSWFIPQKPRRRIHWVGFCGGTPITGTNNNFGAILTLIAGQTINVNGTPIVGPTPGSTTYTLGALANCQYSIERQTFGTMVQGVDVNVTNNGQTIQLLKPNDKFNNGEVFILHFITAQQAGSPAVNYASPLAGYVYYQWFRDQAGNLSSFGVVEAQSENSTPGTGMLKMADAFNQSSNDILTLWAFLDNTWRNDPTVYPSYDRLKIDYQFFKKINKYGI